MDLTDPRLLAVVGAFFLLTALLALRDSRRSRRRARRLEGVAPQDPLGHDRFYLEQRFRPVVNQYEVFTLPAEGKEPDAPVCFVQQRRFKFKEDLRAYTDETRSAEVFRIKARQRFDPWAKYDVTDGAGARIGGLGKAFGRSLLRSTWEIVDSELQMLGKAQERRLWVAILRRVIQLVPYVENIADLLPIPYHFDILTEAGGRVGTMTRLYGLRDRYVLDMAGDPERRIDRRLLLALAVGLDAMQAR